MMHFSNFGQFLHIWASHKPRQAVSFCVSFGTNMAEMYLSPKFKVKMAWCKSSEVPKYSVISQLFLIFHHFAATNRAFWATKLSSVLVEGHLSEMLLKAVHLKFLFGEASLLHMAFILKFYHTKFF
jgi:hypothetical protein